MFYWCCTLIIGLGNIYVQVRLSFIRKEGYILLVGNRNIEGFIMTVRLCYYEQEVINLTHTPCRYFESTAYIHEDVREGVVRVSRMLLHTRYPRYGQEGYHALYTRPPVIYTAATVRPGLPQHLATMVYNKLAVLTFRD